jgi:hypothetical protein
MVQMQLNSGFACEVMSCDNTSTGLRLDLLSCLAQSYLVMHSASLPPSDVS